MDLNIEPHRQTIQQILTNLFTLSRYVTFIKTILLKTTTSVLSGSIFATTLLIVGIFKAKNFIDFSFDSVNKTISTVLSFTLIMLLAVLDVFTHIKQSVKYTKIERIEYSELDELFWTKSASLKLGDNYQTLITKPPKEQQRELGVNTHENTGGFEIIYNHNADNTEDGDYNQDLTSNFSATFTPSPKLKSFFTRSDDKKLHWWKRETKPSPQMSRTEKLRNEETFEFKHIAGPDIEEDSRDDFGIPYYNLNQSEKKVEIKAKSQFPPDDLNSIERDSISRGSIDSSYTRGTVKKKAKVLERKLDLAGNRDFLIKCGITKDNELLHIKSRTESTDTTIKSQPNSTIAKSSTKQPNKFKMMLQLNHSPEAFANNVSTNVLKNALSADSSPKSSKAKRGSGTFHNSGINLLAFSNKENVLSD